MSAENGPPSHRRVVELFEGAIDLVGEQRRRYLDEACADDAQLRSKVESLLDQDEGGTKAYLKSPLSDVDPTRAEEISTASMRSPDAPERVGPYRIIESLGVGGMGRVYLAQQSEPIPRQVALKIVRVKSDVDHVLGRFEKERNVLALMKHPNICRILDGGKTEEGLPYFVMDYVEGAQPLTDYARGKRLARSQRLELFLQVCDAVQHGHEKGVLHRDLKPSNILVGRDGIPKLIDFGVARSLEGDSELTTRLTEVGLLMGTLQYMSPEQLGSDSETLDERSDIYSLGVILYELLVGDRPYDLTGMSIVEAARTVTEVSPRRPAETSQALRGDLDTILQKLLEKDRERRYSSCLELRGDIERYLRSEPVLARPPSLTYQVQLFTRRNRGLTVGLALAFVAMVAGTAFTSVWAMRAQRARADAEKITQLLTRAVGSVDPIKFGKRPSVATILEEMLASSVAYDGAPVVQAQLLATIGRAYLPLGQLVEAEEHLVRARELFTAELGPDHRDTLAASISLALVYSEQERAQDLSQLFEEIIPRVRTNLERDDPLRLEAVIAYGRFEYEFGDFDRAQAAVEEAVSGYTRLYGVDHPDTLAAMATLGGLYSDLGWSDEAERILFEVMDLERELFEANRNHSMSILARYLWSNGRVDEAEEILREAYELSLDVFGEDHPWSFESALALMYFFERQDMFLEGDEFAKLTLASARKHLGDQHPMTHRFCSLVGAALTEAREFEAAARLHDEAVAGARKTARRRADLGEYLHYRGICLGDGGDAEGAERDFLEAYEIYTTLQSGVHRGAIGAIGELMALYERTDRSDLVHVWRDKRAEVEAQLEGL